jgi:plastocyanin
LQADVKQNEQRLTIIDLPLQSQGEQMSRPIVTSTVLAAVVASVLATGMLFARAESPSSTVSIDNFSFSPKTLTVKAGTTVTWTNRDDIPHGLGWTNNSFPRSKVLDTDDTATVTFTTPGTYQYFCYLHPHMVGSIVVEASTGNGTLKPVFGTQPQGRPL